jgi:hypothetical protein
MKNGNKNKEKAVCGFGFGVVAGEHVCGCVANQTCTSNGWMERRHT